MCTRALFQAQRPIKISGLCPRLSLVPSLEPAQFGPSNMQTKMKHVAAEMAKPGLFISPASQSSRLTWEGAPLRGKSMLEARKAILGRQCFEKNLGEDV